MVSIVETVFGSLTVYSVVVYLLIFGGTLFIYKLMLIPLFSPLQKLPTRPRTSLLFGNMKEIFALEAVDPYVKWIKEMNSPIVRYYQLLGDERVMIADADAMKQIMVTNGRYYQKPTFLFKLFVRVAGYGLISLNGKEHMAQRKFCMGAFKIAVIKNMIPSFRKHTKEMIDVWKKQIENGNKELNIQHDLHLSSLDIICECGFGYNSEAITNPDKSETRSLTSIISNFKPSLLRILAPFIAMNMPTKDNRDFEENLKNSDKLINDIIQNKKKELNQQADTNEEKVTDLLTMLLLAKDIETEEGLSTSQIRDHVMTFLIAGHETVSTGMSWFLLQMARNPDMQKRLRDEVESILPAHDEPLTADHIDQMTYLNLCLKETLRLYPPAPMTFRQAMKDDTLCGYFIPKGTVLNIQVGALQRNPKYWTDPEEFIPERFQDESKIYPYSYLPFIAGTRMCIGYKFALLEMKVVLAMLIKEFNFELLPNVTYVKKQAITMKPNPQLKLNATLTNS